MDDGYVVVHFTHDEHKNELMVLNEDDDEIESNYKYIIIFLKLLTLLL